MVVMGTVSPRLRTMLESVRDGVEVSVIVTTLDSADLAGVIQNAQATGAGPVGFRSQQNNMFGIDATKTQIRQIAGLDRVDTVFPDEPTIALGGGD